MKKIIFSILALTGIAFANIATAADIWDVLPCDSFGTQIANGIRDLKPGEKAYFMIRFLPKQEGAAYSTGTWDFYPTIDWMNYAPEDVQNMYYPKSIGVFLASNEGTNMVPRYATWEQTKQTPYRINSDNTVTNYFTDVIFGYEVQVGDFALPIVLAAKGANGRPEPVSNKMTGSSYYLHPTTEAYWKLRFNGGNGAVADWSVVAAEDLEPKPLPNQVGIEKNPVGDVSLRAAGYYVRGFDFSNDWEEEGAVWRSVHEGDETVKEGSGFPKIVSTGGALSRPTTFYLWSLDETVVAVKGPASLLNSVDMADPADPTRTKTYKVLTVTMNAGQIETTFSIEGKQNGGSTSLVLSPYNKFIVDKTGPDPVIPDSSYITVPVRCIEPSTPSVTVKVDPAKTITAVSDWQRSAASLTVSIPASISNVAPFKVRLTPKFKDARGNEVTTLNWADYVRFATISPIEDMPSADNPPEVTLGGGKASATVYVFALRADGNTRGKNKLAIELSPVGTPPVELSDNDRWFSASFNIEAQNPEIVSPSNGSKLPDALYQQSDYMIDLEVKGSYADGLSELANSSPTGYVVMVRYNGNGNFKALPGMYTPDSNDILKKVNDDGTYDNNSGLVLNFPKADENSYVDIYLKAPASGNESHGGKAENLHRLYAEVKAQRSVSVSTFNENDEEATRFREGEVVTFRVTLSEPYDDGDLYAYLRTKQTINKGQILDNGDDLPVIFYETFTNDTVDADCIGIMIPQGNSSVDFSLILDDGTDKSIDFYAVLTTSDDANSVTNQDQLVTIYAANQSHRVTVTNIAPVVELVTMNDLDTVLASQRTFSTKVASGQKQSFTAELSDPSEYDTARIDWEWKVFDANGTTLTRFATNCSPDDIKFVYDFPSSGTNRVEVRVKDKDMGTKFRMEADFVFYVNVLDNPSVEIGQDSYRFDETDTENAVIEVGLSFWPPGNSLQTLGVNLEVKPASTDGDSNVGELVLNTSNLVFRKTSAMQRIGIKRMDGTPISRTSGFTITASVTNTAANAESPDYSKYFEVGTATVYVNNVAPNGGDNGINSFSPQQGTNRVEVAGGADASNTLHFDVLEDVYGDFHGKWEDGNVGIKVTILGGGADSYTTADGWTNGVKYFTKAGSGDYVPNFGALQGDQSVTIMIEDKDKGRIFYKWDFTVSPSKSLVTIATGPSGGDSASALSAKYAGASGIGKGHVWVDKHTFTSASNYNLEWNCSKADKAVAYAFGYRVGAIDDGTLNANKDCWLDKNGNHAAGASKPAESELYHYDIPEDPNKDSFFYAWIQTTIDDSNVATSTFLGSIAPERNNADGVTSATIQLAAEQKEDKTYPQTVVEAIFSREYRPDDNMGDINQDGIPDLYLAKYGFGVIDESTGTIAEGGKDLKDISKYNDDRDEEDASLPDYLPKFGYSQFDTLIPGMSAVWGEYGTPFNAKLEIRGYHDGLNDAPVQAGLPRVKPDRVYAMPVLGTDEVTGEVTTNDWQWTAECSISELEFIAWTQYATANSLDWKNPGDWAKWSPERPTNPMLGDTDGDGFTDGYEYYFWYRAHVGDPNVWDRTRRHVRITGRRYDPKNPGEGTLITAEEIERLFDPLMPSGDPDAAKIRDTDNDGLPDYIEFLIGTNPLDFDTDGDGLPDGWELMVANLNPLTEQSIADSVFDTNRNGDGDAMAITSWQLEQTERPLAVNPEQIRFTTFAVIDRNGDTDGVQWFGVRSLAEDAVELVANTNVTAWLFTADGRQYISCDVEPKVVNNRLANTLAKGDGNGKGVYLAGTVESVTEGEEGNETTTTYAVCGYPVYLAAGAVVDGEPKQVTPKICVLKVDIAEKDAHALWIYGKGPLWNADTLEGSGAAKDSRLGEVADSAADYGCLALGRNKAVTKGAVVCAMPSDERDVALMHYLVYQEFGFDPRTAWNPNYPLHERWGKKVEGQVVSDVSDIFAGYPARTRAYRAYDEFLVYSFFVNNGCDETYVFSTQFSKATHLGRVWSSMTTNPRGLNDGDWIGLDSSEVSDWYYGRDTNRNGADTDGDGVPDGWELYVMAGPKKDGAFVFAPAYAGFLPATAKVKMNESYFSPFPFMDYARKSETSNVNYLGDLNDDGLTQFREFECTDAMAYYETLSDTIKHDGEWKWINKFFPTDPWSKDTDGDGVADNEEGSTFIYGSPVDNGSRCVAGGGLNPCSVDTDLDGLPDPWEKQFKGSTVYTGSGTNSTAQVVGNPPEGLIDGMDGTVQDAYTKPDGVNRDYDRDGLENWQEYLTGTMRCWRYDDPHSPMTYIPCGWYWEETDSGSMIWKPDFEALGVEDENEFWYRTLVDETSPIYNPRFVTDFSSGARYFSRVTNVWDVAFIGEPDDSKITDPIGAYYWFCDRIGGTKLKEAWELGDNVTTYACCSPIKADTDQDGMDDYYELFHGMNPLLGESGVITGVGPLDIVSAALKGTFTALENVHTLNAELSEDENGNGYDFRLFPWLNGIADADPDGDGIPNQEEALLPMLAKIASHTDPTPLWMTDTTFSNSLTRMFFRLPRRDMPIMPAEESFEYNGKTYMFRDFDGWRVKDGCFGVFSTDSWKLSGGVLPDAERSSMNWVCSFEENEGFDSDHDGVSDYEEKEGRYRGATDPQNANSPRRRQAMYFQGPERPSALQTMPFVSEHHPVGLTGYPDDISFAQFTAECWVRPEVLNESVILERTIWTGVSHPADSEYMRKNFRIGIQKGSDGMFWYAMYDPIGTADDTHQVTVVSSSKASSDKWTHLAVSYDGVRLRLYVDGELMPETVSGLAPSWGATSIAFTDDNRFRQDYEYNLNAIIIGAGVKTQKEGAKNGLALNVANAVGFDAYTGFFKGWIDEVRIWDGARTTAEIREWQNVRCTEELAAKNRADFYDEWSDGKRRYAKGADGKDVTVMAELRFHWSFDSIFGADNEKMVAKTPHGFDSVRATMSRPAGYEIAWWKRILDGYKYNGKDSVYNNPAWVNWIPNTVTHLPRFDGTTLDSFYWSEDFMGDVAGTYRFPRTAEPVSMWTQVMRVEVKSADDYRSTGARHWLTGKLAEEASAGFRKLFQFTGRNLNQVGDDLIPLGGAYACYCDDTVGMWDEQGPSTIWEISGKDSDGDGLPDWWETYANQNYRGTLDPSIRNIGWNTIIDGYNGCPITAGEAYLRDIANGAHANDKGDFEGGDPKNPSKYLQTADEDGSGIPDWWEDMYGIRGESGLTDHDHDGLPNYVEYLLSEVFAFRGLQFNPTKACSVDSKTLDYFIPVGSLYVGEIFTDHDLVEDAWEDVYSVSFASRLTYDAFADKDEDGWSNRSEVRYSKQMLPTVSDRQTHYTAADGLVADYPIPTLTLTLRYNGDRQNDVRSAPVVVEVTSDTNYTHDADAIYRIGASSDDKAGTGTSSGGNKDNTAVSAAAEVPYTRTIGKWSNRHALGTLTPGNIKIDSIELQFCSDPSSLVYRWLVYGEAIIWDGRIHSGTRSEYDAARRKWGYSNVELLSADSAYTKLEDVLVKSDETSSKAVISHTRSGMDIGTVNLVTGEFDLDLGVFEGKFATFESSSNSTDIVSLEEQTYRIAYTANPSVGLPRELYLGEADIGHIREGRNMVIAWADLDGDNVWDVNEPYGIVRDVDISWRGTSAEIELLDQSAAFPRIDLASGQSNRGQGIAAAINAVSPAYSNQMASVKSYLNLNVSDRDETSGNNGGSNGLTGLHKVSIVRWMVNGIPLWFDTLKPTTVFEKQFTGEVRTSLTEADYLVGGGFDFDWGFNGGIPGGTGSPFRAGVTNVSYLVFLDGNPLTTVTRKFGVSLQKPVPVAPGAGQEEIVSTANPTFRWKMNCLEDEAYTAFRIKVYSSRNGIVYDSGVNAAPSRINGEYVWTAPLYVGDVTLQGKVFANKELYFWDVEMYNAKYTTAGGSSSGKFYMEVQENGYFLGAADVAVRYFGPKETWSLSNSVIRVQAFTSPDFTGKPVAAGYVAAPGDAETGLAVTGKTVQANCQLIGIPNGNYYLRAFIDQNNNGVCDQWETQGYLCLRDGTTPNYLDPITINFYKEFVGKGDTAVIYLEDSDTDGDGLPDGWEYAMFGNLTKRGVELLSETPAGEVLVNTNLSTRLVLQANAQVPTAGVAGLVNRSLMSNAGTLALALGAKTAMYDSFGAAISGAVSPELVEDGVKIASLEMIDGKVVIAVEAETTGVAENPLVQSSPTVTVICTVNHKENLDDADWTAITTKEIVVGDGAVELDLGDVAESGSGFYQVVIEKK